MVWYTLVIICKTYLAILSQNNFRRLQLSYEKVSKKKKASYFYYLMHWTVFFLCLHFVTIAEQSFSNGSIATGGFKQKRENLMRCFLQQFPLTEKHTHTHKKQGNYFRYQSELKEHGFFFFF